MSSGDTAWLLISAALVMVMVPGLALFYGGIGRARGVLNMLMMSFGSIGVVGVLWVVFGYSMTFGPDVAGLVGSPWHHWGLTGSLDPAALSGTTPALAFAGFQGMFAMLTVALISGAVADRARFGPWLLFAALWVTVVYFPVAHWVFAAEETDAAGVVTAAGGWIVSRLGAIDFAGGTAVHINSGAAALAVVLVLGRRTAWPSNAHRPHNLPMTVLGSGLLMFGWFGFNAGSALAADGTAALALVNTVAAASAAVLAWLCVERLRDGRMTSLGASSGVVAGLVGITPACAAVTPVGAIAVGALTSVACVLAVGVKYRFGYDDALDVVGLHLVGGLVGTVLIGVFAAPETPGGAAGLLRGGGVDLLFRQVIGAVAVLAYSFVMSALISWLIRVTVGFRVSPVDEAAGIDLTEHGEIAYDWIAFERGASASQGSAPEPVPAEPVRNGARATATTE